MKQQFIGLQHCKCGMSWKKDIGFFERTPDMVFGLWHNAPGKKPRRMIEIRRENLIQFKLGASIIMWALFSFGKET